jgi:hypothetical protein
MKESATVTDTMVPVSDLTQASKSGWYRNKKQNLQAQYIVQQTISEETFNEMVADLRTQRIHLEQKIHDLSLKPDTNHCEL